MPLFTPNLSNNSAPTQSLKYDLPLETDHNKESTPATTSKNNPQSNQPSATTKRRFTLSMLNPFTMIHKHPAARSKAQKDITSSSSKTIDNQQHSAQLNTSSSHDNSQARTLPMGISSSAPGSSPANTSNRAVSETLNMSRNIAPQSGPRADAMATLLSSFPDPSSGHPHITPSTETYPNFEIVDVNEILQIIPEELWQITLLADLKPRLANNETITSPRSSKVL